MSISPQLWMPDPVRVVATDEPGQILRLAEQWFHKGPVALATLVDIRGGAAKALGSHMAIAADGRFCGYVSGGCVEAAVASESLLAMAQGRDRMVMFGDGSPFFDIVLPCGGGITVAIHLLRMIDAVRNVNDHLARREQAALLYCPENESLENVGPRDRSQWFGDDFLSVYRPRTRVVISGQTLEADAVVNLAKASGYDIARFQENIMIDSFSAVVLLHHDLDAEAFVLDAALTSPAFYIGALGSTRTHHGRTERLMRDGHGQNDVDRIKAPIGMFGPARDATSLALSILADIAAARLAAYG